MSEVNNSSLEGAPDATFGFSAGATAQQAHSSWFRGEHCNFNPTKEDAEDADAILKYILKGWIPEAPFVSRALNVTAFGSCFAANISLFLHNQGYRILNSKKWNLDAYIIECGEGMVNTHALLQQFEWAFEDKKFSQGLWHGYGSEEYQYDEAIRRNTLHIFQKTELFIITLGLSEVWYDKVTNEVFWRAIPIRSFDPSRHGFRVSTHEENRANIEKMVRLIRTHRPDAHVLFTVSPIPLVATFRPQGCVSANSVSKAILRSALDEVLRAHGDDPHLHYFPSYEIVTSFFRDPFLDDRRHVKPAILDLVMHCFERHYCEGDEATKAEKFYTHLATALTEDQQLGGAERAAEAAIALGLNVPAHQIRYAGILAAQGKTETAVGVLQQMLAADPTNKKAARFLKTLSGA
jgi:hypothetical protein